MTRLVSDDSSIPDWEQLKEEICCPMCGYNLRGLTNSRCPECGYAFEWPDLLDPARRLHPYLFEHHPERNLNSFRRTLLGGFRPRRFWTSLHPAQPSCPRRIVTYWLLAAAPLLAAPILAVTQIGMILAAQNKTWNPRYLANPNRYFADSFLKSRVVEYGSLQAYLDAEYPTEITGAMWYALTSPEFYIHFLVVPYAVAFAWPWLTCITLMILSTSMRRARVHRIHVLRCVLYSFDVMIWLGLGHLLLIIVPWALSSPGPPAIPGLISMTKVHASIGLPILLYGSLRLWIAYRLYLRFPHPFATILVSQVIVLLIALNALGPLLFA